MKHVPNPSTVPNPAPGPIAIKIISGCQTGTERAALDVAIIRHLSHGGWCIHGRQAEDGPLPTRYLLIETPTDDDLAHNVVPTKYSLAKSSCDLFCRVCLRRSGQHRDTS